MKQVILIFFLFTFAVKANVFTLQESSKPKTLTVDKQKLFEIDNINLYGKLSGFMATTNAKSKLSNIDKLSDSLTKEILPFLEKQGINSNFFTNEIKATTNTKTYDFTIGISYEDLTSLEFKYFDSFNSNDRIYGVGFSFFINIKPSNIKIFDTVYPYLGFGIDFTNIQNQTIGAYELPEAVKSFITITNLYKNSYSFSLYNFVAGIVFNLPIKNLTLFTEYHYKYGEFDDSVILNIDASNLPIGDKRITENIKLKNTISTSSFGVGVKYVFF